MTRRRSAKASAAPRAGEQALPPAGLERHEAALRVEALLRERARLLREVQKKKLYLERAQAELSRSAAEAAAQMAPLVQRHDRLIAELALVFAELLAPGRISARARKQVVKLRRLLELKGVLAPAPDDADREAEASNPDHADHAGPTRARPRPQAGRNAKRERATASAPPEVSGAEQVGQERRSLRELFRSLAKAIHPDQARHDAERARRTEVMKEVTRAYEEGDLARLLELESGWLSEQAASEQSDSLTRSRELERINRELLDQIRQLTRRIRDTKRETRETALGLSPSELREQASRELDELDEIRGFLRSFRDGKLTITELERGPRSLRQNDELELLEQLLWAYLDDEDEPEPEPRRRRRRA